jgi:hypothetical protein
MRWLSSLSTGSKLLLGGATLLFLDLFLTWQKLPLQFGKKTAIQSLDAWDGWGLLIGLLTLGLIAGVVFGELNEDLELDSRFELALFGVSSLVLAVTIVKNLRDDGSAWASYAGVVLAGVMTVGAFLDWREAREDESSVEPAWWAQPGETRTATRTPPGQDKRASW